MSKAVLPTPTVRSIITCRTDEENFEFERVLFVVHLSIIYYQCLMPLSQHTYFTLAHNKTLTIPLLMSTYIALDQELKNFSIKYHTEDQSRIQPRKKHRYQQNSQTLQINSQNTNFLNESHQKFQQILKFSLDFSKESKQTCLKSQKAIANRSLKKGSVQRNSLSMRIRQQDRGSVGISNEKQLQIPRVPIEYYDERDNGNMCDLVKGRVVYRGYAPKNSYYFLNTLKQAQLNKTNQKIMQKAAIDYDLEFNSKFESGNLSAAVKVSKKEYWLFMREDTNTHGLKQWYFFPVSCNKAIKIKFRIYQFSKHYSLYTAGMKPFIKKVNEEWKQDGVEVKYQYNLANHSFFLEFSFIFTKDKQTVFFATLPPYTYSQLTRYLHGMQSVHSESGFKINIAGYSLGGLQIPIIEMIKPAAAKQSQQKNKQAVVVLCRTHPAQTCSNFALESFIDRILKQGVLLDHYDIFIYPMVNPDGVFLGNHRTSIIGMDLNRKFNTHDNQLFPEISVIRNGIAKIQQEYEVEFLIDLHGHSARKNIFAYGEDHQVGSLKYLKSRALPKILDSMISSFKYDYCVFKAVKQKKNTARVYFSNKCKINAITFEQSYGLLDNGPIGIENWRHFGKALADSLVEYTSLIKDNNLYTYLENVITTDKITLQKKAEQQKQFLLNCSPKPLNQHLKIGPDFQSDPQKYSSKDDECCSIQSSQLQSGDEEQEMREEDLEEFRKQMRVGCLKEGVKRQLYSVNDKKLQLRYQSMSTEQPIMHEQKMAIMPRILRMKMRSKRDHSSSIFNILTNHSVSEKGREASERISHHKICLPNIHQYLN